MNPNDVMKYGHFHFLRTLDALPQPDWEIGGACGVWSVKDIIGHIASYEVFMDEILVKLLGDPDPTPMHDAMATRGVDDYFAKFNDEEVDRRASHSPQQARDEYLAAYERVAARGLRLDVDTWRKVGILDWYGEGYSLEDYVVYAQYGHKREHLGEINAFRDRLNAQRGG